MDITITLNPEEQAALEQMIDASLRHAGTGALNVAVHFKNKLDAAKAQTLVPKAVD